MAAAAQCLLVLAFLTVIANGATYGCIENTIEDIAGNYIKLTESQCKHHSLWIKNESIGASYVIYYSTSLTGNLEGFGVYYCDSMETYMSQVDEDDCEPPGSIQGCHNAPAIFCPALGDQDIAVMVDGGGADTNLQFLDIPDFYNCTHWYVHSDTQYTSQTALSFSPQQSCSIDISSNGNSPNHDIPGGSSISSGGDSDKQPSMKNAHRAVLWTFLSVFIIVCLAAIAYLAYLWRRKRMLAQDADALSDTLINGP